MGRSKFPGKPSKPVNRTRINVLPASKSDGENNVNVPHSTKLKKDNCDSESNAPQTNKRSVKNKVRLCHNRQTARRQRVCNKLISGKPTSPKRRLLSVTSGSRSQKIKARVIEIKGEGRSEKELSNKRKLTKIKQSHLETNSLVGKFVLPSRSVHSSRVIKPNKRFINIESVSSVQLRTFKKRVVNQHLKLESDSLACKPFEDGDHNRKCIQNKSNSTGSQTQCCTGRVILRQARLQLHTQSPIGTEGPFSSTSSSTNVSPPGTVTCGVCGAVRFYRFVKQARKFNIYSCESCRKFISKMIKHQVCNKKLPDIQCLKGHGMCHVPPVVRSQHWKFRCAYKARCNACWLKMCLRSFQMPINLKNNLINLLPDFMRDSDTLSNKSLFSFHTNTNPEKSVSLSASKESPTNTRPVRKKVVNARKSNIPVSDIKRQKIDLKGPRVKHVCRSASIVLGQPLAIFSDDDKKQPELVLQNDEKNKPESVFENDTSENKENNSSIENKSSDSRYFLLRNTLKLEPTGPTAPRDRDGKTSKNVPPPSCVVEAKARKRQLDPENSICVDFWENYDPEEACRNGFGLISSVSFSIPAICFLCGSAGRDPLLFCCLCCEPYHPFCLEPIPKNLNANEQCYDWLCPRCTLCHACGEGDKQKINCQKCHKAYHPDCFNIKWQINETPKVCSACLRCKSCGTNNITKFIGNTPLCLMCFKLRKKGNFCPLCQRCYDDNDYDTKMMECGKCSMWVHAKCEGLSEEQYQILSLLPESIEFICCICDSLPYWRKEVDSELRASFYNVLKLLSKNRIARNILKWSPLCFSSPNSKMASAGKKLQFSDESDLSDCSSSGAASLKQKYKLKELRVTLQPCTVGTDEVYLISEDKAPNTLSLLDIKNKLNSNEYLSLREFSDHMEEILETAKSSELLEIYHSILKEVFPWYNANEIFLDDSNTSFCNTSHTDLTSSEDTLQNVLQSYKHKMFSNSEYDIRTCNLCKGVGDGLSYREGRLLYCGNNEWVHANCALWSSEVYEEIDGSLQNVHSAITRGRLMRCSYCKDKGASIGCCAKNCHETYHFLCAHTIQCSFMLDKSIYCPLHPVANTAAVISSPTEFIIRRSVYVEVNDKKKKRYAESNKVQFMVGSLCVTNLGFFVPIISDNPEAIIPANFSCKRLFWSTSEPWKLVPYIITSRVHRPQPNNVNSDRNFTVDHTLSKFLVDKKLKDIVVWQKDQGTSAYSEYEDEEEPPNENAADILSPELTDAILEELSHEFLDGISMQDIFPKLMNNEELLSIDFKTNDGGSAEFCKNDCLNSIPNKKTGFFEDVKEETHFQQLSNTTKISKVQNNQRSCSVTVCCKVDNSMSPPKQLKNVSQDKSMFFQLLQVDGAFDNSSSSDSESTHEVEDLWTPEVLDQPVKCTRCQCTYRTQASYKRHLESCEALSTSDSDSEGCDPEPDASTIETSLQNKDETEPCVISSYESYSSYTQNSASYLNDTTNLSLPQNSEIFISNIEQKSIPVFSTPSINPSASIPVTQSPRAVTFTSPSSICEPTHLSVNTNQTLSNVSSQSCKEVCINQQPFYISQPSCSSMINHPTISIIQTPLPINPTPITLNQTINASPITLNQAINPPITLNQAINPPPITLNQAMNPPSITLNQAATLSLNTSTPLHINQPIDIPSQQITIQSIPMTQEVPPVVNITPRNQLKVLTRPNLIQNHIVRPVLKSSTVVTQRIAKPRSRPRSLAAKRNLDSRTLFLPHTAQGGPSIMVQHLPSTNMIPTFIEAFQQQTGQNLQYITTITPQITPAVTNQPQIVHLQPEGTLLNLMSGAQPTVIFPQPRILGDQLLVDNNGALVWASQQVQPIFYGYETIVQNTVLQSQQFLPGTVPGVLTANSSYSSTTQVFQTSKLEPMLDVASGNIVLLNPSPVVNPQPIVPQTVPNPAPPPFLSEKPPVSWSYLESNNDNSTPVTPIQTEQPMPTMPVTTIPSLNTSMGSNNSISVATSNINNTSSCINLPIAPFIPEPGIPTNVVIPTPKPIVSTQPRPMNRVLPMPTNNPKLPTKIIASAVTRPPSFEITSEKPEKHNKKINILEDIIIKPIMEANVNDKPDSHPKDDSSLKLIFQKQREGGVYKISNNFTLKNTSSIQIAPLKPMKAKNIQNSRIPCVERNLTEKSFNISLKPEPKPIQEKQTESMVYNVETYEGFHYSSTSLTDLWSKVFETVQAARVSHNMPPLPPGSLNVMNNFQLLGLQSNGLKYLLEQLPGASRCAKYKPRFHSETPETDLNESVDIQHPFGTARCIPHKRSHEPSDMFGWLASKHRKPPTYNPTEFEPNTRRGSLTSLPMAMRFRNLKLTSKQSVGVYRSNIHKRGLFCHRDIESGEMVIEYAGEVIRSVLADKREKHYTLKGMGCYMFRIDENFVVDATMKGNAARFINHSCEPNCYSKVVEILGHKHIIIFALRKILCGEELTYDYKFPFEEDKIPCTCGSRRCRKFLN